MKSRVPLAVALLLAFGAGAIVSAKGTTTRVVISGPQLGEPIELRDRAVVAPFNVWSGPGTRVNGVEQLDGFIVDWRSGALEPSVADLQQFEICFYVDGNPPFPDRLAYVVSYGFDPKSGDGYVYLPGRSDPRFGSNVRSIVRGSKYEGHWFRASRAWQDVFRTYVVGRFPRVPAPEVMSHVDVRDRVRSGEDASPRRIRRRSALAQ